MTTIATPSTIDPLKEFMAGAFTAKDHRPIPLVSTKFDVDIDGGLVTVVTKRVFRNDEAESIEATITFPVPVHAVLFGLEARIGGRLVTARAQRRTQAREAYEDAIERGKAAVLHEEVLHGVHMLSVAHIGPGAEIEVSSTWASALSYVGDRGQIRIPLTVGDIYGRSGLAESDDFLLGGPVQRADLVVRCREGSVSLLGASLEDGRAQVALNAPIDLVVTNAMGKELRGRAADGREVHLRITPHRGGDTALNAAFLIDHSGSMSSVCSGRNGGITKHQAIVNGLKVLAPRLGKTDSIDLWEFDNQLAHIGASKKAAFLELIARLTGPEGGTEIGGALAGTIAGSDARDILLVTDGKSHALDVQKLARMGRRITVVLVGDDSLEANVGHLAALTGGDILVAADSDISDVLLAAVGALRAPFERPRAIGASLDRVRVVRGNTLLEAAWTPATQPVMADLSTRAVAAIAASLALPALDEARAAQLAEAEGLVTHLTSLVLVDEAGEVQAGVPATRKVALPLPPAPAMPMAASMAYPASPGPAPGAGSPSLEAIFKGGAGSARRPDVTPRRVASAPTFELSKLGSRIDWDKSPNDLLAGNLSALDPQDARLIAQAASRSEAVSLAMRMSINPTLLIVALLAQSQSAGNRSAARIAKAVLDDSFIVEIRELAQKLGLATGEPFFHRIVNKIRSTLG